MKPEFSTSCNVITCNKSFENVSKFKYLGKKIKLRDE
jgi:hypothetical protein